MIILDKPYVSDLLKDTIIRNNFSVLGSALAHEIDFPKRPKFIENDSALIEFNGKTWPQIYSNSENAINWISTHLNKTDLPDKINLFKDKVRFRDLLSDMYTYLFYKAIAFEEIENLNIETIPKPFIIKPAVGFFSMGVYKVFTNEDWISIPDKIKEEVAQIKGLYPDEVMNSATFIIEQLIEGDEFAFDAYFNNEGKPVVLGIFKHLFSSGSDVGDRVYYSSKEVIEAQLHSFTSFLSLVGERAKIKNFPVHVEVRVNEEGELTPIEINPMRFGGWCTTADLTAMAYNLNPYEYYFQQKEPNWPNLLKNKEGIRYCLIVLDNSTGYPVSAIADFDYDALLQRFKKPLDLRKIDWSEYPVFGMLFTETHVNDFGEIASILKSNLKEFVTLK